MQLQKKIHFCCLSLLFFMVLLAISPLINISEVTWFNASHVTKINFTANRFLCLCLPLLYNALCRSRAGQSSTKNSPSQGDWPWRLQGQWWCRGQGHWNCKRRYLGVVRAYPMLSAYHVIALNYHSSKRYC